MQIQLTAEEQEALRDVMTTETWKTIMKLCDVLVNNQANVVLTCKPDEVISARSRFEGASMLATGLKSIRKQIVNKED